MIIKRFFETNGIIVDLKNDVEIDLIAEKIFLCVDLDREYDNPDLKYIPGKIIHVPFKELVASVYENNIVLEVIK